MGQTRTKSAPDWPRRARVGAVLAVLLPPVGFALSFVALRRISRDDRRARRRAIFGVACGGLLTVLTLAAIAAIVFLIPDNAAQKAAGPLVASVRDAGGRKLCDNGDAGIGPDNREPWYQAYFEIADRAGLTAAIEADAKRAGYPLHEDTERIAALQDTRGPSVNQPKFNPKADYLVSSESGNRLEVTIERDTKVPLYCSSGHYGRLEATGEDAIVTVSMQLPRR